MMPGDRSNREKGVTHVLRARPAVGVAGQARFSQILRPTWPKLAMTPSRQPTTRTKERRAGHDTDRRSSTSLRTTRLTTRPAAPSQAPGRPRIQEPLRAAHPWGHYLCDRSDHQRAEQRRCPSMGHRVGPRNCRGLRRRGNARPVGQKLTGPQESAQLLETAVPSSTRATRGCSTGSFTPTGPMSYLSGSLSPL